MRITNTRGIPSQLSMWPSSRVVRRRVPNDISGNSVTAVRREARYYSGGGSRGRAITLSARRPQQPSGRAASPILVFLIRSARAKLSRRLQHNAGRMKVGKRRLRQPLSSAPPSGKMRNFLARGQAHRRDARLILGARANADRFFTYGHRVARRRAGAQIRRHPLGGGQRTRR